MLQALRRQGGHELAALLRASSFAFADANSGRATGSQYSHGRTNAEASTSARWAESVRHSPGQPGCRSFAAASRSLHFKAPDPDQRPLQSEGHGTQSSTRHPSPGEDVALASKVLQQVSVNNLVQRLESEATERVVLPVEELYGLIQQHGITEDRDEAAKIVSALQTAGIILRCAPLYLNCHTFMVAAACHWHAVGPVH